MTFPPTPFGDLGLMSRMATDLNEAADPVNDTGVKAKQPVGDIL